MTSINCTFTNYYLSSRAIPQKNQKKNNSISQDLLFYRPNRSIFKFHPLGCKTIFSPSKTILNLLAQFTIKSNMIVITGALGFIGSCLVRKLNDAGHLRDIVVVDDFYNGYKEPNLDNKYIREWIHRNIFLEIFEKWHRRIQFVFHLGARTDTAETSKPLFDALNVNYSKALWDICTRHQIPLVYASSAATYGNGKSGYSDAHNRLALLKPLNAYGRSKQQFDRWVLNQKKKPPFWAGLKFFNVYGPNEWHKGRMASVVYQAFRQISESGELKLFKSHKKGIADGQQQRDFVYIKDVVDVLYFLYQKKPPSAIYNVGTGQARSFEDLAKNTFKAMGRDARIRYIDTPKDIRRNYQYFTEAKISKLRKAGYKKSFHSLEAGVQDYVQQYLMKGIIW